MGWRFSVAHLGGRLAIGGPMHLPARRFNRVGKLGEIGIEFAQGVGADLAGAVAHGLSLGQGGQRVRTQSREAARGPLEGDVQLSVSQGVFYAVMKSDVGRVKGHA